MSSRFVSGGTISAHGPGDAAPSHLDDNDENASARETREPLLGAKKGAAEWEAVRQELEEDRRRREAQRVSGAAAGAQEQSLYDVLQANKAAKQAAFEEQNKLKNQFRPLDDDEVNFLDEVRAKELKEEERLKRETEEGLRVFRLRQKSSGGTADEDSQQPAEKVTAQQQQQAQDDEGTEDWAALGGRKRKRVGRENQAVKGVKRKNVQDGLPGAAAGEAVARIEKTSKVAEQEKKDVKSKGAGGKDAGEQKQEKKRPSLVAYDSDDDD